MSEKNRYKKGDERRNLDYFVEAYHRVTGVEVNIIQESERPDFIGQLPNNSIIGIELTKITRSDPEIISRNRILEHNEYMLPENAIEMIQRLALLKNEKKSRGNWECHDNTILLIELVDIPLSEILILLEDSMNLPDIGDLSFVEIWLGDYTQIDAYDNIELFCLYPDRLRGYYQRPNPMQKPYG